MSTVLCIGLALIFYSWLLSLICTTLPLWTYHDQGTQYKHTSLWKTCTVHDGHAVCEKISGEDWIRTVQAFMIMSVIILFISMVSGFLRLKDNSRAKVNAICTLSGLAGGFFVLISVIVYGVRNGDNSDYFSASYYLAIISAVTAFIGALMFILFKRRDDGYAPIMT